MTAIRFYREKAGMTQTMLGDALGVSQGAIANWESGDRKPDIFMLKKIAGVLKCTTDNLLCDPVEWENGKEDVTE